MEYRVFYNPTAGNGKCKERISVLADKLDGNISYYNVLENPAYSQLIPSFSEDDRIIICGGDGTLNHFINDTSDVTIKSRVYFFGAGSGNDFLRDIGKSNQDDIVEITGYLNYLPTVKVNGIEKKFINGIGYGIDGYCCEEGDRIREKTDKPINYTPIAIKGLLYAYKPTNAKVIVDGVEYFFKKVWLAPTMFGRFFGGGMRCAPNQDRNNDNHTVTVCPMFGIGKLKALLIFPQIFKGEHVKHQKYVKEITGKEVEISFDRPSALQIDGETVTNVLSYSVKTV